MNTKNDYNFLGMNVNKQQLGVFIQWFFLCLSVILWNISVFFSSENFESFGLFNGLNFTYYVGLFVVILNLSLSIYKYKKKFYVILNLLILFFYLFGISFFITLNPRIFSGFQYIGHWEYLDRVGELNPNSLWYHSWPGMFFLIGLLMSPLKGSSKYLATFIVYPLVYRIIFALFLFVLIKEILKLKLNNTKKEKNSNFSLIITLILINLYDWISQDYFTSQSIGFLLFLVGFIFIVDYYSRLELSETKNRKFLYDTLLFTFLILFLSIALAFTHMVSSIFLFTTFLIFGVVVYIKKIRTSKILNKRKLIYSLIGLIGILVAFISVLTSTNWFKNNFNVLLSKLLSFEPKVFQLLFSNLATSSQARLAIIISRLIFSAIFIVFTIYILYRILIKKRKFIVPIFSLLITLVSLFIVYIFIYYSDEVFQRTYLFFIPIVIFALIAVVNKIKFKHFIIIMLVLSPLFLLSKYGNEEVDIVTDSDIRLIDFINENYITGTVIISPRQLMMGNNFENYNNILIFSLKFTGSTFCYISDTSRIVTDEHLVVLTSEYYFRVIVFRNQDNPYSILDLLLNSGYYSLVYNEDNNYVLKHMVSSF